MLGTYHLNSLFDILGKLHFQYDSAALWKFVLEESCRILQAEAGTFFELSASGQQMQAVAVHGSDPAKLNRNAFKLGSGICGWVGQYQQPVLVPDVRHEPRFNRTIDQVTGFSTRSILCIPVFSQKHHFGVVEILNRRVGTFQAADQEFMTILARQTAIAAQNLQLKEGSAKAQALLESLLANMRGGLIAVTPEKKISLMNPAARQLLHWKGPDPVGKDAAFVFLDGAWPLPELEKALSGGEVASRAETRITLEGTDHRIGFSTMRLSGPEHKTLGAAIIFQDLS